MSSGERRSEMYLRKVIELLHGVTLELFDRDGLQNVVDYIFTSPSGDGAVEITTAQDSRAAAWFSKLNSSEVIECAGARGWTVVVELSTKLAQLKQRLPAVIAACDRHQVDRPELVPVTDWDADVHGSSRPASTSTRAQRRSRERCACRCRRRWASPAARGWIAIWKVCCLTRRSRRS